MKSVDEFQRNGSGWVIKDIIRLDTTILEFDPLRASTYIPLPKEVSDKKAVINIKNDDEKCFLWAVIAAMYPVDNHVERLSKYIQHANKFNVDGITFPMPINQIKTFEEKNDLSISVYEYDSKKKVIEPIKVSQRILTGDGKSKDAVELASQRHIDLLFFLMAKFHTTH